MTAPNKLIKFNINIFLQQYFVVEYKQTNRWPNKAYLSQVYEYFRTW